MKAGAPGFYERTSKMAETITKTRPFWIHPTHGDGRWIVMLDATTYGLPTVAVAESVCDELNDAYEAGYNKAIAAYAPPAPALGQKVDTTA